MVPRVAAGVLVVFLTLLVNVTTLANAQDSTFLPDRESSGITLANLEGRVSGPDNQPAAAIRVDLNDATTSALVTYTYTQPDGTFALYNIPSGKYEVVAAATDAEVKNQITVPFERSALELRLPESSAPAQAMSPMISVAEMLVPERAQKLYRKAVAAFRRGNNEQTLSLLKSALVIAPQYPDALTLCGLIAMQSQDLDAAQQYLEHAIRLDPTAASAYIGLGAVYNHQGRFDDALVASQHAAALSPRSWQGYFEMSKAFIAKGMYQKGLEMARQAERLGGSSFARVHLIKAYALVPLKLYHDARSELQAFLSRETDAKSADQAKGLLAQISDAHDVTIAAMQ